MRAGTKVLDAAPRQAELLSENGGPDTPVELETVACLHCGGNDFEPVITGRDRQTGVGGDFTVASCVACGLQFTNPRPTLRSIGLFYPEKYRPWDDREAGGLLRGKLHRMLERSVLRADYGYPPQPAGVGARLSAVLGRLWIRRSRQRMTWVPFRPPGRLLDFGCGRGDFLAKMLACGWQVEGVDVSPVAAAAVERRTGIRVHVGTLPHAHVAPQSFDAVTMWNSLEHVHQPRETVRAARDVLRPGGLLALSVPNIDSWTFRRFGPNWWPLDLPRHLTHFTPATLGRLLEAEGFRVLSIDHIGRAGMLRKSVHQAFATGHRPPDLRRLNHRWPAESKARWTERTQQADIMRALAERPAGE
ncbi:MAG: class I SAM-dependent methyltransferase [Planctomycetes bacterium]|nr:class I SAM-dependent methyltransferase [Planctomycetota bacterium]